MGLLSGGHWSICVLWARVWWDRRIGGRIHSSRGQAVMEYFVLFILISLIAAVCYSIIAPVIEAVLVKMANVSIAKNVAGE
jgi:uncharacterized protein (UPF0333 family)